MAPRNFHLTMRVAFANIARGNLDSAERLVQQAAIEQPSNPDVHRAWGHILMARGQIEDAVFAFESAAQFGPREATIQFELAEALVAMSPSLSGMRKYEALQAAHAAVKNALRRFPEDADAIALLEKIEDAQVAQRTAGLVASGRASQKLHRGSFRTRIAQAFVPA